MLFLVLLVGAVFALDDACLQDEFEANGRFTGQNIDMNYDETALLTDNGATKLRVQFFVPRRYTEQYQANAFAITFHREREAVDHDAEDWQDKVQMHVDEKTNDRKACFSNRYDNYTHCATDDNGGNNAWTIEDNAENDCIQDVYATFEWADVMADAFGEPVIQDNGRFTEIFLTATVETWTHFVEGDVTQYQGVMTGNQEFLDQADSGDTENKKGVYGGDGGWRGVGDDHSGDFGNIVMDDERYTLYQIPFILRFPKTVTVQASFKAASPITVLTGVIGQDVIQLEMDPSVRNGQFAYLEAVLTTQVQYPYGVRGPSNNDAPMSVFVGGDVNDADGHAAAVEIIEYDQHSSCGGVSKGEMCEQEFKIRITPHGDNPCTVAGDYTFEFWVECVNRDDANALDANVADACTIDDLATDGNVENRRNSNAYMKQTINIDHQPFCPVLVDEVRVVGDFSVYHDEAFSANIVDGDGVFTNDILFYEANYRTTSNKATEFTDFNANDFDGDAVGDDQFIDFVRATKIFMDVTIGKKSNGDPTDNWNGDDWEDNFDFSGPSASGNALGATRIPDTDITGDDLTVTQDSGDAAIYQIELCSVSPIAAEAIEEDIFDADNVIQDCFTDKNNIATEFLDMDKVMLSKAADGGNTIDENEVAFKLRMDERIIPLKPAATDGSFVKLTIESEVYYKGNRNPTRRLLQAAPAIGRNQKHSMSASYPVYAKKTFDKCNVGEDTQEGHIQMSLSFEDESDMPSTAVSLDWAARLTHQLESYLETPGVVKVAELAQCNDDHKCQTIYVESRAPRRRLDNASYLKVDLLIHSSNSASAGRTMNKLQDHVIDRRSQIHLKVQAFRKATVTGMAVPDCGEHVDTPPVAPRDKSGYEGIKSEEYEEQSSAAAASTLVASLVALWALRF